MKHTFICLFLTINLVPGFFKAQNPSKEWVLVNKKNGREIIFKKDEKIIVYWQNKIRSVISLGKLSDLSDDSLFLYKNKAIKSIAKKDIRRLEIDKKNRSAAQKLKTFALIFFGVCIVGYFLIAQAACSITRRDYQLAAGEKCHLWPWASVGIIMIIWGAFGPRPPEIQVPAPFGENWIVQERILAPGTRP